MQQYCLYGFCLPAGRSGVSVQSDQVIHEEGRRSTDRAHPAAVRRSGHRRPADLVVPSRAHSMHFIRSSASRAARAAAAPSPYCSSIAAAAAAGHDRNRPEIKIVEARCSALNPAAQPGVRGVRPRGRRCAHPARPAATARATAAWARARQFRRSAAGSRRLAVGIPLPSWSENTRADAATGSGPAPLTRASSRRAWRS